MTNRRYYIPEILLGLGLLSGLAIAGNTAGVLGQQKPEEFFIHEVHSTKLEMECVSCHQTEKENSVDFDRPGHDECISCHKEGFETKKDPRICTQCHSTSIPTSGNDLLKYPLYKKERALLTDFSHAKHVDARAPIDPKTGFRADCTFCHKFEADGIFATFPGHTQCVACHAKEGINPPLTSASEMKDCRGCHNPEEIEHPGSTEERVVFADHVVSGVHVNLKFTHIAHFRNKDKYNLNCTSCHYAVPRSTSMADLTLPKMVDCVECHDVAKDMNPQFRMSNCQTCHIDSQRGAAPVSHTRNVKPAFHTESFRTDHAQQATEPGAKCFVCHTNLTASGAGQSENQCISCHQVMKPASHTARWRDDVHGKSAALDKASCATCHAAESCVRCHNQTPRSHAPLSLFTNGGHATAATLDQRSCMTCHSFQDTCSRCHKLE